MLLSTSGTVVQSQIDISPIAVWVLEEEDGLEEDQGMGGTVGVQGRCSIAGQALWR